MTSDWQPTAIDRVWLRHGLSVTDERGSFSELWRASVTHSLGGASMAQANLSRSHAGVLRGMHVHLRQDDVWVVLDGRACAAMTDLRGLLDGAAGAAPSAVFELRPGDALYIPARVAHGFLAIDELTLVYLVSNEYDGSDELGFAWDDADAAIAWPATPRVVSGRDRANPSLADLVARLRQGRADSR